MNMILKIQSVYNQFTKAEKKVADYCLQHREEVPFLSITDLADACGVGDTSVYRFCRTLKLEGYQEFKMKFSLAQGTASMEARLMRGGTLGQANTEEDVAANGELARRVLETHQNAIAETYMMLDREELEKVLNMLDNARRVYFFGIGDSLLVAQEAMSKFLRITGKVNCIQDPHMQAVAAAMMNEEDLVFIISYSGATKDNLQVAKLAKESGAKVAAISHIMKSPLTA